MKTDPVTLDADGGIGVIRLNRPQVHNAVDGATMEGLEGILDRVDREPDLRALVLTGAGERSFCAGGDLTYFAGLASREDGARMSRRMTALLGRLADGPRPAIAAVNGDVFGGGCEVLVSCHLRLAVAHARFSFRQAAMGVVTGWGGGVRALRLLGRARALRLLLTADVIDAAEARRLGLVDDVVDEAGRLMDEALGLARRIAANPPEAVAAFLDLARTCDAEGAAAARRREAELFSRAWVGERFQSKLAEWSQRGKA